MSPIHKMLIACSAAVEDVVELPECRADAKRYAMIGGFVLLTSVFAFFSGGFALYTGFQSVPIAAGIAVAWAAMIFTIDRFVVSTIRKSDVEGLPWRDRLSKRLGEWTVAMPR